jgi:tRNA(fMet)-specific endonuclease VapC
LGYGTERYSQPKRNLTEIEGLAARLDVVPFHDQAATHFGQSRAELYKIGKPIGPCDMLISGYAGALGLILVTNNMKEFERSPGLRLANRV